MKQVIITNEVTGEQKPATVVVPKSVAKEAPVTNVFKAGLKAISMPTPELATKIFRVVLYAAALVSIVLPMFPEIPENIRNTVINWSLRLVALTHAISKLFGIDITKVIPPTVTTTETTQSTVQIKR